MPGLLLDPIQALVLTPALHFSPSSLQWPWKQLRIVQSLETLYQHGRPGADSVLLALDWCSSYLSGHLGSDSENGRFSSLSPPPPPIKKKSIRTLKKNNVDQNWKKKIKWNFLLQLETSLSCFQLDSNLKKKSKENRSIKYKCL